MDFKIKIFLKESIEQIEDYWKPTERIQFESIYNISAKTNLNVEDLCLEFRELIDELDDKNNKTLKPKTETPKQPTKV